MKFRGNEVLKLIGRKKAANQIIFNWTRKK